MPVAGTIFQQNLIPPVIKIYRSESEQMADITNQVNRLLAENIEPAKIAILYQTDAWCDQLEQHLRLKKIFFYNNRSVNILDHPFINKIIQLLRYISSEHDMPFSGDHLLFNILHFDFFEIPAFEIAMLAIEANKKKGTDSIHNIRHLLQQKANAPAKDLFDTGINKELKRVFFILEKLVADVPRVTLKQLFENISGTPEIQNYIGRSNESNWLRQLLLLLTGFIENKIIRNPRLQLTELIAITDQMKKERIPITGSTVIGSADHVHLLDSHTTKELKYDHIFFAGENALLQNENNWFGDIHNLSKTNFLNLSAKNNEENSVGLDDPIYTEFAPQVFISYVEHDSSAKESALTVLIKQIAPDLPIAIEPVTLNDAELKEYDVLHRISQPEIEHLDEVIIGPILDKFVMSVSALNSYLDCPLGFYYKNILRVPAQKNEAMEFGSAVHDSLEKLFKKMTGRSSLNMQSLSTSQFTSAAEMLEDFKQSMLSRRGRFTTEAFQRRMEYGVMILNNYYDHYIGQWNRIVSVERNISGLTINGIPVKGKLDKLEFDGKDVTIVDYKTGDIEKALLKTRPPDDDHPNGGDYWRQAVFYKILVDNYEQKRWKVIGIEFDFIEPDKNNQYRKVKIQAGPTDIETVKQQITEAWGKIQRRQFYTGCGRSNCHWCNFVKNNSLAVTWHTSQQPAFAD